MKQIVILFILLMLVIGAQAQAPTIWDACLDDVASAQMITASSHYVTDTVPVVVADIAALTGEPLPWSPTRGFYARQHVEYVRYEITVTGRDGNQVFGLVTRNVVGEWFVYLSRRVDVPHADCGAFRLDGDFRAVIGG